MEERLLAARHFGQRWFQCPTMIVVIRVALLRTRLSTRRSREVLARQSFRSKCSKPLSLDCRHYPYLIPSYI